MRKYFHICFIIAIVLALAGCFGDLEPISEEDAATFPDTQEQFENLQDDTNPVERNEVRRRGTSANVERRLERLESAGRIGVGFAIFWTILIIALIVLFFYKQRIRLRGMLINEIAKDPEFLRSIQRAMSDERGDTTQSSRHRDPFPINSPTAEKGSVNDQYGDNTRENRRRSRESQIDLVQQRGETYPSQQGGSTGHALPSITTHVSQNSGSTSSETYIQTLYSPPAQNGVFVGYNLQNRPEAGESIFKIMYREGSEVATFMLIDDHPQVLRQIAKSPDSYLSGSCELYGRGPFPNNPANLNSEPGRVLRKGKNWHVTEKVKLSW